MSNVGKIAILCSVILASRLAAADDAHPDTRDPVAAAALSAGGAVLSIGIIAVGGRTHNTVLFDIGVASSLVAPSAGEIYAGDLLTLGMGIRVLSASIVLAGLQKDSGCSQGGQPCDPLGAVGLAIIGVAGYTTGILYDIATAPSAADRYNKKHRVQVTPIVTPTASGRIVGLGIRGSF